MNALESLGNRVVTLARARAYASIVIAAFGLFYVIGLARGRGLVDGFGHVVGGDLLAFRTAGHFVFEGSGTRLYDPVFVAAYQQQVVGPTRLPGVLLFMN